VRPKVYPGTAEPVAFAVFMVAELMTDVRHLEW
jgi:hypothetical protein